jgi:hypothetical protein
MLVVWLGALLFLGGVVFMMAQPIWRGRLSDASKRTSSGAPRDTLEPRRPGAGFTLKANWPGLVLIVLGGILLLAGAGLWPWPQ